MLAYEPPRRTRGELLLGSSRPSSLRYGYGAYPVLTHSQTFPAMSSGAVGTRAAGEASDDRRRRPPFDPRPNEASRRTLC